MVRLEVAVVSGILYFVGNKLAQLLISEYSSIIGATKDLQELHALVKKVNCWLETADDKVTGTWLRQLKDVAYAADSFVDEFQLKLRNMKHLVLCPNLCAQCQSCLTFKARLGQSKTDFLYL